MPQRDEKMRERALLKEYEAYKSEKKIKTPRLEALRLGFQKSYEAHDYATIVAIAKKIPSEAADRASQWLLKRRGARQRLSMSASRFCAAMQSHSRKSRSSTTLCSARKPLS